MNRSTRDFERWNAREKSSWPFRVFQKHNAELSTMLTAQIAGHSYVYEQLGKSAA